jgi:DNA mismatch repair protein MSH4
VTQEFFVKDRLVKNTLLEISHMSNAVLDELLVEVREYIGFLYKLSETLSTLDMLTSLATVSMSHDYVKPQFGDSLAIKQGRHPILDTSTSGTSWRRGHQR